MNAKVVEIQLKTHEKNQIDNAKADQQTSQKNEILSRWFCQTFVEKHQDNKILKKTEWSNA